MENRRRKFFWKKLQTSGYIIDTKNLLWFLWFLWIYGYIHNKTRLPDLRIHTELEMSTNYHTCRLIVIRTQRVTDGHISRVRSMSNRQYPID